jgi:hypothetical protein
MSLIGDHLRVPLGLGIDNIRDFILEDPTLDKEETADITVAPDSILDHMYERMVLYPLKRRDKSLNNKTHKNKNKN